MTYLDQTAHAGIRGERAVGPWRRAEPAIGVASLHPISYTRLTNGPALVVASGKTTDGCYPRHRNEEFLRIHKQVAKTYPR